MKKKYITPQMQTVLFRAPVVMLVGSNTVNDFNNYNNNNIIIGDGDD